MSVFKSVLRPVTRALSAIDDDGHPKTIWAVAGGKGGTGKSFVASSLALLLASEETPVIAIDADLGGPNLHTFLGLKDVPKDLGDFVTNNFQRLDEVVMETPYPGLKLIKGTENVLFVENLNFFKKIRMIRQIRYLDARQIIIDNGSGSSFNTLDFFVLANAGIVIITPDPTSIENSYYFMKSCVIRLLKIIIDAFKFREFSDILNTHLAEKHLSITHLFNSFMALHPANAQHLYAIYRNYQVHLIVNLARQDSDYELGPSIADIIHKFLHIDINFLGTLPYDPEFDRCLKKFTPLVIEHPEAPLTVALRGIAEKMARQG
jgi:flagellar biosynthesis protein FlhG